MERKEIAVGEIIDIKLKCVETKEFEINCDYCAFSQSRDICEIYECSDELRSDGKYVHFEIV